MSYTVRWQGGYVAAGPFAVLDTAVNEARSITQPPPKPPKQYTHLARTLGTTDTDPFDLLGIPRPAAKSALVVEEEGYGKTRVRAFVTDGKHRWALDCKACAYARANARGNPTILCTACDSLGAVPDMR